MTNGVCYSEGVNMSNGVSSSNGVNWGYGVNWSYGVNRSNGVNYSEGVSKSNGVNMSYGVNRSEGVSCSNGVNRSYGVINSCGVSREIFCADKKATPKIFGQEVSEERFKEVWKTIHEKANGWHPKFNNAFELYVKVGNDWKKVQASDICSTLTDWNKPYEAWKDMPDELLEYIKSLPEFDAGIFKRVTGIDVTKEDEVEIKVDGVSKIISRKSAIALGLVEE